MEVSNGHFIKVTQQKYAILKKAKSDLYQNVSELKSQIRSQMSRLQEALQNREVQLLNQVDLLQKSKEKELQKKLNVVDSKVNEQQKMGKWVDKENYVLNEEFGSLSLQDVLPEQPHMEFKPMPIGLKDVVMNFGKIISNENPSPVFTESDKSSNSLLKADAKKIENKSSEKSISVNVLPFVTNEWLAKPRKTFSRSNTSLSSGQTDLFAPFMTSQTSDWLLSPKPQSSKQSNNSVCLSQLPRNTTIQNWLHQIKHNSDSEEDGFEILDSEEFNSDADSDSIEIVSTSPASIGSELFKNVVGCKRSTDIDTSSWLAVKRKPLSSERSSRSLATFSYFKKVASEDPSIWLYKKKSLSNVPTKAASCGDHGLAKHCDIENLGDSSCIENLTKKFKELSQNPKSSNLNRPNSNFDHLPPVSSVCKANEVCEKYSECVTQPNCGERNWFANVFTDNKGALKLDTKLDLYFGKKDLCQPSVDNLVWLKMDKNKENKFSNYTNSKPESVSSLYDWLSPESQKNIQVLSKQKLQF
ncbi:nuclear receptor coactivator 4-like [Argonauta hians]